jgi:hypothetical protein
MASPPLDARALAYFSFVGTVLSALGGLFLTYDFFHGRDGPLAHLTRAATYAFIFGIGYGIPFGPFFGLVNGIGLGPLLALEFHRVRRHQRLYGSSPLLQTPLFGVSRGLLFGLASIRRFGWRFSVVFGLLSGLGLFIVYAMRYAPTNDYTSRAHFTFTRHRMEASLWRGTVIGLAGAIAGWLNAGTLAAAGFGFSIGLTVACVSVIVTTVSPRIEWWIENLPDRHLGLLGVAMILTGLTLQTVPDLVTILGMPVKPGPGPSSYRARYQAPASSLQQPARSE